MRFLKIGLLFTLLLTLLGCSRTAANNPSDTTTYKDLTVSQTQRDFIALEDNFLSSGDEGVKKVTENADGTLTFTVSEDLIERFKDATLEDTEQLIDELTGDKESYPAFYAIDYNDELTEFTVAVDDLEFQEIDEDYATALFPYGNLYQLFDEVADENLRTTIYFINKDTDEEIQTLVSTDFHEPASSQ